MFLALYSISFSAIVSIIEVADTMPIFTASGGISVKTASSSLARNSAETSIIPVTPKVFCAVRAVMAQVAKTPFIVMVFISA